jgi:hypothetical protein
MNLLRFGKAYWILFILLSISFLLGLRYFQPETLILSIFAEAIVFSYAILPADIAKFDARLKQPSPSLRLILKDAMKILGDVFIVPLAVLLFLAVILWQKGIDFTIVDFVIIIILTVLSVPLPKNPRIAEQVLWEVLLVFFLFIFASYVASGEACIIAMAGLTAAFTQGVFLYSLIRFRWKVRRLALSITVLLTALCIFLIIIAPSAAPATIAAFIALGRFLGWIEAAW